MSTLDETFTEAAGLEDIAGEALETLQLVAQTAAEKLGRRINEPATAIVNLNSLTGSAAIQTINEIADIESRSLLALQREPAISRVVVEDDDGKASTYYICRSTSIPLVGKAKLAGYRTNIGRLAARDVGDELDVEIGGKNLCLRVLEKVELHPEEVEQGWDSRDSIFRREDAKPISITSLRKLIALDLAEESSSAFDAMLASDGNNVTEGLRHQIRNAMGLRDQPVLDKFQDDIFRLPLDSQLIILGPPGTGKTTTLIKRLGQKLDWESLDAREKRLLGGHRSDWVMFTPSELLKHYVKEAFGREQIPTSNDHIKTWDKFRSHLARNIFSVLKTHTSGAFYLKDGKDHCSQQVRLDPRSWFEEFRHFHYARLIGALRSGAEMLQDAGSDESMALAATVLAPLEELSSDNLIGAYEHWLTLEDAITEALKNGSAVTEERIHQQGNLLYNRNNKIFFELAGFLESMSSDEEEDDDEAEFDEDPAVEQPQSLNAAQRAFIAYRRFLQSYARSRYRGRRPAKSSRAARIFEWLGDGRVPSDEWMVSLGKIMTFQNALRRFRSAWKRHVLQVPASYRAFRQKCISDGRHGYTAPEAPTHIDSAELDAILLLMLRSARELLSHEYVKANLDSPRFYELSRVAGQLKAQVLVDEATDFSMLQLACMESLADINTGSFFACGDFNQRITSQGIRSFEQVRWVSERILDRRITTVYRQSQKLNAFAGELLNVMGGDASALGILPEDSLHVGVDPVLREGATLDETVLWLADRLGDIERMVQQMPTVAVLVPSEESVRPVAEALTRQLESINLKAEACTEGKTLGDNADIRVFDIQHIKGLEFEAVFFVGVDELAERDPELFHRFLYVGATRAATYLGLVCYRELPEKLSSLRASFEADW